ncbi:Pectate trisaccharide-lyase precursor [Vibrio aerogenes CECT 7868]|uniref:Pectate trisaccharide-lyase n=1 Tax=Vibrio aerogenes CECT 7868 TaxID=1216006 RepID=A0A1M5ZVB8_9VIBR|nr:cellulose binding domain-containing protein [Vibrio aerogenes]SHI28162.1 Pectate trisaccharide-lyase precursor [Vibrio aerogenes CECT 7868]
MKHVTRLLVIPATIASCYALSIPEAAAASCSAKISDQWSNGYQMEVTINSEGNNLQNWQASLDFTQAPDIVNSWNAKLSVKGSLVTASNLDWNGNVPAGESTSFYIQGNGSGNAAAPSCTLSQASSGSSQNDTTDSSSGNASSGNSPQATSSGGPDGYTFCANEGESCQFSGTKKVAYGASGKFNYETATNSVSCDNSTFGDPIYGSKKACYYQQDQAPSNGPSGYTPCAKEGETCQFSGTRKVAYGASGKFNYQLATNSISCDNNTFGDPIYGTAKECYYGPKEDDSGNNGGGDTGSGTCPVKLYGWATVDGGTTGGGNVTPQRVTSLSELRKLAKDSQPRVLELSGTFTTGDEPIWVSSNKTLVGIGKNTTIKGGIRIKGDKNIIIRNMSILGNNTGRPVDSIGVRGSHNIWFDHLTVTDGPDGILDLTKGTDHVTVSWSKFYYTTKNRSHRLALLFGGGSTHGDTDTGKNNHTIHHNWFGKNLDQRMPRLLFGKGHIYNNYYNAPGNSYAIGSGSWASLLVENNYFKDINSPHRFQDSNPSYITARGNIYDHTTGKKDTGAGGSGSNPPKAWTNPPYQYHLDAAKDVPSLVTSCAGPQ